MTKNYTIITIIMKSTRGNNHFFDIKSTKMCYDFNVEFFFPFIQTTSSSSSSS